MNCPRPNFFSGAGFAGDENGAFDFGGALGVLGDLRIPKLRPITHSFPTESVEARSLE